MSIEETRARLDRRIRQAIADSHITFTADQQAHLNEMIGQITDGMLVEFDAILGSMLRSGQFPVVATSTTAPAALGQATGSTPVPEAEEVLWEGRPFLSLGTHYTVTNQRVRVITGLLGKDIDDIEIIRIQDVDHTQGITERVLNVGDIFLRSTDPSRPRVVLRNVTDPVGVHEIIRRAILEARRRYPFAFRQEI
jgi:hypothetical protein